MTEAQAKALIQAAGKLPEVPGIGVCFSGRRPCCSLGWILQTVGHNPYSGMNVEAAKEHFGLDLDGWTDIGRVNDHALDEGRRAAVLSEIERQIREAGFDPVALRESV